MPGQIAARQRPEDRQRGEDQHGCHGQDRQHCAEMRQPQCQQRERQRSATAAQQEMTMAFARAVRVSRNQDQADRANRVRNYAIQADRHHIGNAEIPNHQWHPEIERERAAGQREIDKREDVQLRIAQCLAQSADGMGGVAALLIFELPCQQCLFASGQPFGIGRVVDQVPRSDQSEQNSRRAFDREHPLPAEQAHDAGHVAHDPTGNQATQHAGDGDASEEDRHHGSAAAGREPVGHIQHDAGEEAGFEYAKQETQRVELCRRGDEGHSHRDGAPQQHDPRERTPRAEAGEQHIAWHFAQHIADVEHRGTKAVHCIAEAEVVLHLQLREADIDAVEEGDDVADEQEGDDPHPDLLMQRVFFVCEGERRRRGARVKLGHALSP